MNICLLSYRGNPYSGGQGIYLKYIAEELVKQGHTVHVIVGPPYPDEMKGVIVHRIKSSSYYGKEISEAINPHNPMDIFNPVNFYQFLDRFPSFLLWELPVHHTLTRFDFLMRLSFELP